MLSCNLLTVGTVALSCLGSYAGANPVPRASPSITIPTINIQQALLQTQGLLFNLHENLMGYKVQIAAASYGGKGPVQIGGSLVNIVPLLSEVTGAVTTVANEIESLEQQLAAAAAAANAAGLSGVGSGAGGAGGAGAGGAAGAGSLFTITKVSGTVTKTVTTTKTASPAKPTGGSTSTCSVGEGGQLPQDFANIVSEIVATLDPLLVYLDEVDVVKPLLSSFEASLDTNLNTIAVSLGGVVCGALTTVRSLLSSTTTELNDVGLTTLVNTLGL